MHRDLKPENILIAENKHLKLVSSFCLHIHVIPSVFSFLTASFSYIVQIDFGDAKSFEDSIFDYSFVYGQTVERVEITDNKEDGDFTVIEKQRTQHEVEVENEIENGFELHQGPGMDRRDTFVGTPLYVSPEML